MCVYIENMCSQPTSTSIVTYVASGFILIHSAADGAAVGTLSTEISTRRRFNAKMPSYY